MPTDLIRRGLRQPWVWGAVLATALEFAGFWSFSPRPPERWTERVTADRPGGSTNSVPGDLPGLLRLWTPALLLLGGQEDFSTAAWMEPEASAVKTEAFAVPEHALPFQSARGEGAGVSATPVDRPDPSPAARWGTGISGKAPPKVEDVRLPAGPGIRVIRGFSGWRPSWSGPWPAVGGLDSLSTPGVVVRLVLDDRGELLSPPVLWEGSGSAAVDEAVLGLARRLRWNQAGAEASGGANSGRHWGLVIFEWGGRPAS